MKKFAKAGLIFSAILACTYHAYAYELAYWYSDIVSEEGGSPAALCHGSGSTGGAAVGVECSGGNCDDVSLLCQDLPPGVDVAYKVPSGDNLSTWSKWFSEEDDGVRTVGSKGWYPRSGKNFHICNGTQYSVGVVTGIKCRGSYCDQLSIQCDVLIKEINENGWPPKRYLVAPTNCSWSAYYSEEEGARYFGKNRFITAVQCRGAYCDDMRYYVCTIDGTKLVDPATL